MQYRPSFHAGSLTQVMQKQASVLQYIASDPSLMLGLLGGAGGGMVGSAGGAVGGAVAAQPGFKNRAIGALKGGLGGGLAGAATGGGLGLAGGHQIKQISRQHLADTQAALDAAVSVHPRLGNN